MRARLAPVFAVYARAFLSCALYRVGRLEASASARNLFDTRNESFGFLLFDPFQGANVRMVHPGPGRSLDLRVTVATR